MRAIDCATPRFIFGFFNLERRYSDLSKARRIIHFSQSHIALTSIYSVILSQVNFYVNKKEVKIHLFFYHIKLKIHRSYTSQLKKPRAGSTIQPTISQVTQARS